MDSNHSITKCKPGDRAKVIKARNPQNIGLIVCVVRKYQPSEIVDGTTWSEDGSPWVVVALSRSLVGICEIGPSKGKISSARSGVIDDAFLVPLDEDDDGLTAKSSEKIRVGQIIACEA